ncbi:hypothetical protein C0J50_10474, partial [Silurus asotus]
ISSPEGSNTTLTCTYDDSARELHWYQQKPQSEPKFLLLIYKSSKSVKIAEKLDPRISIRLHKDKKKVDLEIFPAAVSDSALYYCAMEPTVTQNSYTLYKNTFFSPKYFLLTEAFIMFTVIFMCLWLSLGDSMADSIKPHFTHKSVDEGENITLSCNYETSYANLKPAWYRQQPKSKPVFLL